MTHRFRTTLALAFCLVLPRSALAHAFLDHAVPGVGSTSAGSPSELQLTFTQDVEPALSGVRVTTAAGAAVPAGKPAADGASASTLHVRLARPLAPGTYVVHWHVVSVDTHPTSGTYKFSVSP